MNKVPQKSEWCTHCRMDDRGHCDDHENGDYNGSLVYEPTEWVLSVVGKQYKGYDARTSRVRVYTCVGYDPRSGFWMRDSEDGYETNVSERAINRTFHKQRGTAA